MLYNGIHLDLPEGPVSMSHTDALDLIRGKSSSENMHWMDALGAVPWGKIKEAYPEQFKQASKVFSLANMNYQTCNGGIAQYFDNGYHKHRAPFSEHDVERFDIGVQKEYFTEVVSFAKIVFPDRENENAALETACDAFLELWYEEDVAVTETVECDEDEYIWDDDLEEEVPNPDYFEPYDETTYDNVIHGDCGFDDIFYKANDYLEELLELQSQLCCKVLAREVEREHGHGSELVKALKDVLSEKAFSKPSLIEQIQSAAVRGTAEDICRKEPAKEMIPMPGTTAPDWGKKHWGSER